VEKDREVGVFGSSIGYSWTASVRCGRVREYLIQGVQRDEDRGRNEQIGEVSHVREGGVVGEGVGKVALFCQD